MFHHPIDHVDGGLRTCDPKTARRNYGRLFAAKLLFSQNFPSIELGLSSFEPAFHTATQNKTHTLYPRPETHESLTMAASRTVYPPMQHPTPAHRLTPQTAQNQLKNFLSQTSTKAHLHPDALLSSTGIQFSANSGLTGGLALHHLSRIEAGLRGENLVQETQEELEAVFGEEMRAAGTLRGDDRRVDAAIEKSSKKSKSSQDRVREWEDGAEFAQSQAVEEGEVGDREGAEVVQQGGAPPEIEQHGGKVDAATRKALKKQRRLAQIAENEKEKAKAKAD